MAHSPEGRAATERHRLAQAAITAAVVDRITRLFHAEIDPADIDASSALFVRKALPIVMASRELSKQQAEDYLVAFRRHELKQLLRVGDHLPDDEATAGDDHGPRPPRHLVPRAELADALHRPQPRLTDPDDRLPDAARIARDLHSSGAAAAKRRIARGEDPEQATSRAAGAVGAKVARLVADGGRAVISDEVDSGRNGAIGYARVPDAAPCPFCAMLASRGAVYRSDAFKASNALFSGDGAFMVHDGCGCTLEPIYGRDATDLPPGCAELAEQWAEIASGQDDPWATWRRWRESGTRPGEENAAARRRAQAAGKRPSAPQYGRERARRARAAAGKPARRPIEDLDRGELARAYRGLLARRAGMEAELADLEARGQGPEQPGPAAAIARRLERIERQIAYAESQLT
ncbi:hypothetical protein CSPHI_04985 [Corynebacterium sphenisci DSM 44792]|uniref:Uncharacterized protein n=1 Tax=Corynebacterium sphenisci DSM 44792 TaxID=1437874 RepID=A0A1L7CXF8_9CORY|nr:hypothetical protein [Corynebacterium sphenisci]APT90497.1 hypothetical protein CSPHI_04985 [Corynebacterium sphenisci DSM 44792]